MAIVQCAAGVAYETPCQKGLAYSPEQHVCNYPDSVSYCDKQSEGVVGFKCPGPNELPPNAVARRWASGKQQFVVCICQRFNFLHRLKALGRSN